MKTLKLVSVITAIVVLALFVWSVRKRSAQRPRPAQVETGAAHVPEMTAPPEVLADRRITPGAPSAEPPQGELLPASAARGTIRGRVVDQLGRPVVPARVGLIRAGREQDGRTVADDGSFSFVVSPGEYSVLVDGRALPSGYLPPWNQDQGGKAYTVDPDSAAGHFATEVAVPPEGGEFVVELRAFLAATVAGYVVGPRGEPIEGAVVRIQSCAARAPTGLESTQKTDPAGRFEMLQVYPGKYRTELWLTETTDPRYRDLARPLPLKVVVEEGGIYELSPLQVGVARDGSRERC